MNVKSLILLPILANLLLAACENRARAADFPERKGPPREVIEQRADKAAQQWIKIAELPDEPGLYLTFDLQTRQLCHLAVSPANLGETRMEYSLHCGVDTRPAAERNK